MLDSDKNANIGSLIKVLSDAISKKAKNDFKEYNLTMQQIKILSYLKQMEGREPVSQKDIQDYLRIAHPTVVSILKGMEAKGFIKTHTCETDKRMKIVCLTGKENDFFEKVIIGRKKMENQILKGMTEDEKEHLRDYLKRMYENIKE
ncbi:MAG TPA: MarR family transcriptional regulator [Candidatus Onthocola gallistercoris]|uniref:MarR family transcriptional regulator n=1 Tax=Candidatus Onthocola gallistercoris TaxID=2840876 RepID=A0A9D1HHC8_9FIRM|nr:MarR family transcriptional regulator [Candidatus Onthocola gallistercoris]